MLIITEVLNKGESGEISIGICHRNYAAKNHPGWRKNSFGYHGDDGG